MSFITSQLETCLEVNNSSSENIASALADRISSTYNRVILEGAPIYFFPELSSQMWNSHTFTSSWKFADKLRSGLVERGVNASHWILVDDHNYWPASEDISIPMNFQQEVVDLGIMEVGLDDRVFRESDFANELIERYKAINFEGDIQSKITCDRMDGLFQFQKLLDAIPDFWETGNLDLGLIVIAHPVAFKHQQSQMLGAVLGEMKQHERFKKMGKSQKKQILQDTFLHIWFDNNGKIDSITQPIWNDNLGRFEFNSIELL